MIEYALLAALISIIAILAITAVGVDVNGVFTAIEAALP
jgi:Flp pilus assembly pilin Flp